MKKVIETTDLAEFVKVVASRREALDVDNFVRTIDKKAKCCLTLDDLVSSVVQKRILRSVDKK